MKVKVQEYQEITLRRGSFQIGRYLNYIETVETRDAENKVISTNYNEFKIEYNDIYENRDIARLWYKDNWTKDEKCAIVDYYLSKRK